MEDRIKKLDNSIHSWVKESQTLRMKDEYSKVIHTVFYNKKIGISGVGSDFLEEVSYAKARSEFIERLVCYQFKDTLLNTSGLSAHLNEESAKEGALKELIERDLFLTSWFQGKFPAWQNSLSLSFPYKYIQDSFFVDIGHIGTSGDYNCYIYVLSDKGNSFSSLCGTVCEKNSEDSVRKIIYDLSRLQLIGRNIYPCSIADIKKNSKFTPQYHTNYYADKNNRYIQDIYTKKSGKPLLLKAPEHTFTTFHFSTSFPFPIHVAHCFSPEAQCYFSGIASKEKINSKRIPNSIPMDRIVHPLG